MFKKFKTKNSEPSNKFQNFKRRQHNSTTTSQQTTTGTTSQQHLQPAQQQHRYNKNRICVKDKKLKIKICVQLNFATIRNKYFF